MKFLIPKWNFFKTRAGDSSGSKPELEPRACSGNSGGSRGGSSGGCSSSGLGSNGLGSSGVRKGRSSGAYPKGGSSGAYPGFIPGLGAGLGAGWLVGHHNPYYDSRNHFYRPRINNTRNSNGTAIASISDRGVMAFIIIVSTIGGIFLLIIFTLLCFKCYMKRKTKREQESEKPINLYPLNTSIWKTKGGDLV